MRYSILTAIFLTGLLGNTGLPANMAAAAGSFRVAIDRVDITPKVGGEKPVYMAGYGHNRRAEGVHDPLYARTVVMSVGAKSADSKKIALVSVDLVGLQYPIIKKIRARLPDYKYVMVASTHNHEGPDTIGIWGSSMLRSGVNFAYLDEVAEKIIKMIRSAELKCVPAVARYGTAEDESLLGDSRMPKVYDGVLRAVSFHTPGSGKPSGLLVQWNCHPEARGRRNKQITADFPHATIAALEAKYGCPVAYFSGAVGGLMAPPDGVIKNDKGEVLKEGDFEYARVYGEQVAKLAGRALDTAEPIDLSSIVVSTRPIAIPLENMLYKIARATKVIRREGTVWTGDPEKFGPAITARNANQPIAVETEVGYLRLGQLHLACIPGELYPELVYGKYQTPVDPNADFPKAPLERSITQILPGEKIMIFGLANDEIGYIIPKRQWDQEAPYCYGRTRPQYGEINSCGAEVAPIIMQALQRRVDEVSGKDEAVKQAISKPAAGS